MKDFDNHFISRLGRLLGHIRHRASFGGMHSSFSSSRCNAVQIVYCGGKQAVVEVDDISLRFFKISRTGKGAGHRFRGFSVVKWHFSIGKVAL